MSIQQVNQLEVELVGGKFNMEQFINSLDDASDRFEAFFRNPRAGFKENKIKII